MEIDVLPSQQAKIEGKATRLSGLPSEPIDRLAFAATSRQRQARKARTLREHYVATRCAYIMTFEEFRQEGARNKIRRKLGFDPIILPKERGPQARGNEAKPRRSQPKRASLSIDNLRMYKRPNGRESSVGNCG